MVIVDNGSFKDLPEDLGGPTFDDMPTTTGPTRFIRRSLKSGKKRKPRYVLLLGARKVGKTALVRRFVDGSFEDHYKPTVEDCFVMDYDYESFRLNLNFLDTAGSCEFPAMRDLNIRQASIVILVYDVNDMKSFEETEYLYQVVTKLRDSSIPILLVGTRTDLAPSRNDFPTNQAVNTFLSNNPDCKHAFCSSKLHENVSEMFHQSFDEMIKQMTASTLSHKKETDGGKCCCTVM